MMHLNKLIPQGRGLAPVLVRRAASVELDWHLRQQSRFEATDAQGRPLGVELPQGSVLRGGDVLVGEDGSLVRVIAAAQPVLRITAAAGSGSPLDLQRAAYHLGHRHVAVELQPGVLQIEPDHGLAGLLEALGLIVVEASAPFEPEGGGYAAGGHAPHEHAHADAAHVHGPGCGHDHGH